MAYKTLSTLIILSLATAGTITALANPHHLKADTNQDGEISLAEFNQGRNQRFTAVDTNADGLLSEDERKAHRAAKKQDRSTKRFERLDDNGDGFISRSEYDTSIAKRGGKRHKMAKHRKKMRGHMRKKMRGHMKKADANQDGFIDRAEFDAQAAKIFAHKDANGDGVLSKADREFRKNKPSGH